MRSSPRRPQAPSEHGARRPRRFVLAAAGVTLGTLAFAACDTHDAPPPQQRTSWPAGTALVFDGQPISVDEIDHVTDIFALVRPQNSATESRRLALTNVVFPLYAARGIDAARREETLTFAREHARAVRAGEITTGALFGPVETERSGGVRSLGLEAWKFALDARIGEWSELLETPGAFELVQVKERGKQASPAELELRVGVYVYPYVEAEDPRPAIEAALDRARLVIVDPAWRECVPTAWQYRLKAGAP